MGTKTYTDEQELINEIAKKVLPALIIQRKPTDTVEGIVTEAFTFAIAMVALWRS